MRRTSTLAALPAAALLIAGLAGCSGSSSASEEQGAGAFPITIEHALGETTIEAQPERVATVAWANHEVPLALGVVPVGMAKATWGDDDGDGVLPWVEEQLDELGAETPVLFDETDGIDFEAVADTEPDVILAAYSGLTQEDYDTLARSRRSSPTPRSPGRTSWRDMIRLNAAGIGHGRRGRGAHREPRAGRSPTPSPSTRSSRARRRMFLPTSTPTDLSQIGFYTAHDTRAGFFEDLGLPTPASRRGGVGRHRAVLRHGQRRAGRRASTTSTSS